MYTRGQFALIGKTTLKALRLYEEIGLLKPDFIDDNKYRYYSQEKVTELLFIDEMKSYGFTLDEIKEAKIRVDSKFICDCLIQKRHEVEINLQRQKQILDTLTQKIHALQSGESIQSVRQNNYQIDLVSLPDENAVCFRDLMNIQDIGRLIGKAFEIVGQYSLEPTDTHRIIYHSSDINTPEESWDLEVCIPVKKAFISDSFSTSAIKAQLYAHTLHKGSFSQTGKAHAAIVDWAAENRYKIIGDPFERVRTDKQAVFNPNSIEIEVYYPVKVCEREVTKE